MDNFFNVFNIWMLVKLFFVCALFLYFLFSLVVIRQTQLMTKVLDGKLNPVVKMTAMMHTGVAGLVFLLSLIIL